VIYVVYFELLVSLVSHGMRWDRKKFPINKPVDRTVQTIERVFSQCFSDALTFAEIQQTVSLPNSQRNQGLSACTTLVPDMFPSTIRIMQFVIASKIQRITLCDISEIA